MTTTLTTETYAATYVTVNDQGEYGVDLIHQSVERDEDGTELSRAEDGWEWYPAQIETDDWTTHEADTLVWSLDWRRAGDWQHENDLGGTEGWTAPVERAQSF